MAMVIDRIWVEDDFVIPTMSPIDPFQVWLGSKPTRLQIGDEFVTVVDSGPGWADVERYTGDDDAMD